MAKKIREAYDAVRRFALGLPGVTEDFPWGERVVKVKNKIFVFLGREDDLDHGIGFSVKLPQSGTSVLELPFAEPTGYGLGKHGWISVSLSPGDLPPVELLLEWIEESYRAIAPKKLVAALDARGAEEPAPARSQRKRSSKSRA